MMRLDKFLCEVNIGSRSQVKAYIRQGLITVNGSSACRPESKIDANRDVILFKGTVCKYEQFLYYMLHKPAGVVSATQDVKDRTVLSLLKDTGRTDLFPVGRLDKDTEGLLLITNDGALAHELLSPKKHVPKTYYVEIDHPLSETEKQQLSHGVDIGEKQLTKPAVIKELNGTAITLTITEGKFHQVKRMLQAVQNRVCYLKRLSMGPLTLDETLKPGEYRPLTAEEIEILGKESVKSC